MKKHTIHWKAIAEDSRFKRLHAEKTRFLCCLMLIALSYYFTLLISAAYFHDIFKIKIWGVVNLGILFAISQFLLAWLIAAIYAKRAQHYDAQAKALKDDVHNIRGAV